MAPLILSSTDYRLENEVVASENNIDRTALLAKANPTNTLDVHDTNEQGTSQAKLIWQPQLDPLVDDAAPVSSQTGIAVAIRQILCQIGEDPDREGLIKTPDRYAQALLFFTKGYSESIDQVVNGAIFSVDTHELVILQERLGSQVAAAIDEVLRPLGVAVVLECTHMCMVMRGVQKTGTVTFTQSMTGLLKDDPKEQQKFYNLLGLGRRG
ncbi:hypothetical protein E0Z10_g10630 [Xylaria hypoxylon]|uniref:GTP cyclohydrolase 1 n=1 Tax=Xylaria hypoxylon TaxID=37992 RepID=A0A4Z0YHA5_9PEZI|nr:hypothetical protein E0Z10_g10630 [Xylaria hypoxylon]